MYLLIDQIWMNILGEKYSRFRIIPYYVMSIPLNPSEHIRLQNGFLSERDRRYLLGQKSYKSTQVERNTRQDIRDRTKAGIFDLMLIAQHLPQKDRETLFKLLPEEMPDTETLLQRMRDDVGQGETNRERRSESYLIALLLIHDFVGRELANHGFQSSHTAVFGTLFGLRTQVLRGERHTLTDLQYLSQLLSQTPQIDAAEAFQYIGSPELARLICE
jgi:hypothetical protein